MAMWVSDLNVLIYYLVFLIFKLLRTFKFQTTSMSIRKSYNGAKYFGTQKKEQREDEKRSKSVYEDRNPFGEDDDLEVDDEIMSILTHTPCSHLVQCVEDNVLNIEIDTTSVIFNEKPKIKSSRNPSPRTSAFKPINHY